MALLGKQVCIHVCSSRSYELCVANNNHGFMLVKNSPSSKTLLLKSWAAARNNPCIWHLSSRLTWSWKCGFSWPEGTDRGRCNAVEGCYVCAWAHSTGVLCLLGQIDPIIVWPTIFPSAARKKMEMKNIDCDFPSARRPCRQWAIFSARARWSSLCWLRCGSVNLHKQRFDLPLAWNL